jgi:hypothetical protein
MFPAWLKLKKALTAPDLFSICSYLVFTGPLLSVERREGRGYPPIFEKQPPGHLPEKSKRYRKSAYQLLL